MRSPVVVVGSTKPEVEEERCRLAAEEGVGHWRYRPEVNREKVTG